MAAPLSRHFDPDPDVMEGIITIRTPRELARCIAQPDNRITVIMPMSAQPGMAANMLESIRVVANQNRSTVLVDALGQGSSVSRVLGLPDAPGIFEMISGMATFEESIRRDPKTSLQVISGNISGKTNQTAQARHYASVSDALMATYDHVVYLAGPDETIAILNSAQSLDPALVLVTEPSMSMEDTLWQADQIFGDRVEQPSLLVLADMARKPAMRLPFHIGRATG